MLRSVSVFAAVAAALSSVAHAQHADELDTVTITASPIGGSSLATLVESVGREALLRRGAASLGESLADVAGVSASGFSTGASHPLIRGLDASRVRVLENGIGSFDVTDVGPDHATPIDPLSAERVEIVRGAGALRFGSQAIGGVVNVIDNRVPVGIAEGLSGETSVAYSTAAEGRDLAARLDAERGALAVHADGFVRRTGDYDTPHGVQQGTWFDGRGGALGAGRVGERGRWGAALVAFDADYGLPGEEAHIDMRQYKLLARGAREFDGTLRSVTLDAGIGDYRHHEREPDGRVHATFEDTAWESRAEALFGAVGPLSEAALGLQLQERRYSAQGEAADYLRPTRTRSAALFAFGEAQLARNLDGQVGVRLEHVRIDGLRDSPPVTRRTFTPFSASAGLVLAASPSLQFGLTLASSARAPAQTELFAQGPHDGPGTFEIGDASLGVERAIALEATVHWRGDGTHLEAAVWSSRYSGFIHGVFTGRLCDEEGDCAADLEGDLREMRYIQGGAWLRGVEATLDRDLGMLAGGALSLRLTGDVLRASLRGGGNVPRMPPWRVGVALAWEGRRTDAELRVRHAGRQDRPGELDTPTPGWTSVDAQVGWRPTGTHALELVLSARNLFDTVQRNAASFNKDELLLPGRDIRLLARASF